METYSRNVLPVNWDLFINILKRKTKKTARFI